MRTASTRTVCFALSSATRRNLRTFTTQSTGLIMTTPEELEVNTLENVLYLSMKNDLSFLI